MTLINGIPVDGNGKPVLALWDDATGQPVPVHIKSKVTGADGQSYAILDVNASLTGDNLRVNAQAGDFVDGAIATLGTEADSAAINSTSSWSVIALLKGVYALLVGVLLISRKTVTLFSTAQATVGSGNSGDITIGPYTEVGVDITTTAQAGTSPTITFFWERKGVDGTYYPLWQSAVYTAASNTISTSIGAGMAYPQSLGSIGRLRWVVGGTATPTWTFTPNVYGK